METLNKLEQFIQQNNTEIIKTCSNGLEVKVKQLSVQEMVQAKYEIVNAVIDVNNKEFNTIMYDYIIDTRILKYFADINLDNLEISKSYQIYLNNEIQDLIKEIKSCMLVKYQIETLKISVDKQVEFELNKMINSNVQLDIFLDNLNVITNKITNFLEEKIQDLGDLNITDFVNNIAKLSDINQETVVDSILKFNRGLNKSKGKTKKSK